MDSNIITILISALGGVLITALAGFITLFINNKHSLKMAKEKDKYEYEQYTNRTLYKFLEELERECLITTTLDQVQTTMDAVDKQNKIHVIFVLVKPFLNDSTITRLENLRDNEVILYNNLRNLFFQTQGQVLNENEHNVWLNALVAFKDELSESISIELRRIKNGRV